MRQSCVSIAQQSRAPPAAAVRLPVLSVLCRNSDIAEGVTYSGALAFSAALFSIFVKEGLYHATATVARRYDSKILLANAWHHRSDALSSMVALAGVGKLTE